MCLVEIQGFAKLSVACATEFKPNMKIFTNTKLVTTARENILEFLLCNHPLDCPICDQGGECDLQDQSYIFGRARGRFYEHKRAVTDILISPLIKMIMTRCIHCTRCVRFFEEYSSNYQLGLINRGGSMQINSYLKAKVHFELASNVIDICPVGALTFKPSEFQSRAWEVKKYTTIDFFDTSGTEICIDLSGLKIIRVLPLTNETFVPWISDITRSYIDVYKNSVKYLNPYYYLSIKKSYILTSLQYASELYHKLKFGYFYESAPTINDDDLSYFAGNIVKHNYFLGEFLDLRTLKAIKQFNKITKIKTLGDLVENYNLITPKLQTLQIDRGPITDSLVSYFYESGELNHSKLYSLNPILGSNNIFYFNNFQHHLVTGLISSIIFYNTNLRYEFPRLNSYLTQYINSLRNTKSTINVGFFGDTTISWTYPIIPLGNTTYLFKKFLQGRHWFCQFFLTNHFPNVNWSCNYILMSIRYNLKFELTQLKLFYTLKFLTTSIITLIKFLTPNITILNSYVIGLYNTSTAKIEKISMSHLIIRKLPNWFKLKFINYFVNISPDWILRNTTNFETGTFKIYQSNYIQEFISNLKRFPIFNIIIPTVSLLEYNTSLYTYSGELKLMHIVFQNYKYACSHAHIFNYFSLKLWMYLYLRSMYNSVPATIPVLNYFAYHYYYYDFNNHDPHKTMPLPLHKFRVNFLVLFNAYLGLFKHGNLCYRYFINFGFLPAKCINNTYGFRTSKDFGLFNMHFLNQLSHGLMTFYSYRYLDQPLQQFYKLFSTLQRIQKNKLIFESNFIMPAFAKKFYITNFITTQSKTLQFCSKYFGN